MCVRNVCYFRLYGYYGKLKVFSMECFLYGLFMDGFEATKLSTRKFIFSSTNWTSIFDRIALLIYPYNTHRMTDRTNGPTAILTSIEISHRIAMNEKSFRNK